MALSLSFSFKKDAIFELSKFKYGDAEEILYTFGIFGCRFQLTIPYEDAYMEEDVYDYVSISLRDFRIHVGNYELYWDFPFVNLNFKRREYLTENHTWKEDKNSYYDYETKWTGTTFQPFVYKREYTYKDRTYNQLRNTETLFYRQVYSYKWVPFLTKTYYRFETHFSEEVGPRVDTWKGGTLSISCLMPEQNDIEAFGQNFDKIITESL